LEQHYPGFFRQELMVTGFDVKRGKPDPEPYLMGLEKAGIKAEEGIVVENAPLGVQAAKGAGIFTIAANTGPLEDSILKDAGADSIVPDLATVAAVLRSYKKTPADKS
jgi:beta-phosphoglucomutase-like phosphatase (HAD superfamily)